MHGIGRHSSANIKDFRTFSGLFRMCHAVWSPSDLGPGLWPSGTRARDGRASFSTFRFIHIPPPMPFPSLVWVGGLTQNFLNPFAGRGQRKGLRHLWTAVFDVALQRKYRSLRSWVVSKRFACLWFIVRKVHVLLPTNPTGGGPGLDHYICLHVYTYIHMLRPHPRDAP